MNRLMLSLSATLALASCALTPSAPPQSLSLPDFYQKYVDANGIPVIASARVPDEALFAARDMATGMIAHRADLAQWLRDNNYRIAIIAEDEALLDLPEFSDWTIPASDDIRLTRCERKHYDERIGRLTAREYWDARVRGIGGPLTVGAEEDVLGKRESRYYGETILVHEFAHGILFAIESADPALYAEVEATYAKAKANNLWQNEYAMTTVQEYWAEGTQFWFDSNALVVVDGRQILSHGDLAAYDPQLAVLLQRVYGGTHQLNSDPFWMSEARVPPGPIPTNTAEEC